MSGVKRYRFDETKGSMIGDSNGDWCYTKSVQSELAALLEELAETQQISQQEELRANEYATQLVAAEQRLEAAEQRNARVYDLLDHISGDYTGETKRRIGEILAALKPTESGASE